MVVADEEESLAATVESVGVTGAGGVDDVARVGAEDVSAAVDAGPIGTAGSAGSSFPTRRAGIGVLDFRGRDEGTCVVDLASPVPAAVDSVDVSEGVAVVVAGEAAPSPSPTLEVSELGVVASGGAATVGSAGVVVSSLATIGGAAAGGASDPVGSAAPVAVEAASVRVLEDRAGIGVLGAGVVTVEDWPVRDRATALNPPPTSRNTATTRIMRAALANSPLRVAGGRAEGRGVPNPNRSTGVAPNPPGGVSAWLSSSGNASGVGKPDVRVGRSEGSPPRGGRAPNGSLKGACSPGHGVVDGVLCAPCSGAAGRVRHLRGSGRDGSRPSGPLLAQSRLPRTPSLTHAPNLGASGSSVAGRLWRFATDRQTERREMRNGSRDWTFEPTGVAGL